MNEPGFEREGERERSFIVSVSDFKSVRARAVPEKMGVGVEDGILFRTRYPQN